MISRPRVRAGTFLRGSLPAIGPSGAARLLALLLWLGLAGPLGLRALDGSWNQFRGPNGAGVAPSARPPVAIGNDCLAWRIPVGPGLSSPVLAGERVVLTGVDGERLVTLAYDARTGERVWRQAAPPVPLEAVHPTSSPAASTPCAADGRVFVYFGSYGLLCYDLEGREQWRKPIPTPKSPYGMATSPIVYEDHLILVLDDDANLPDSRLSASRILALRKTTGEVAWETGRPLYRSGWSTPAIWRHSSGEDLVVLGSGRAAGYDPRTGAERWSATGFSRETIAVPVSGNERAYVSSALLGGVSDEQPDPQPFWDAMLAFDQDGDGRIARSEITEHFTFPLRPELPVGHPGFGLPLPADPAKRSERQAGIFNSNDPNKDGYWTRDELVAALSFRRGKPLLAAIRPGGQGDITTTHVAWQCHQGIPEIPSPLFLGDRLYLVRNGGILTVVNATDGTIVYSERLNAPGQYGASPVATSEQVYVVSDRGVVTVVPTGDRFRIAHRHDLKEPALVTPAIGTDTLYVRTDTHLWAFRSR